MRLQVSCVVVLIKPLGNRIEDKYKMEIISSFSTYFSYPFLFTFSSCMCKNEAIAFLVAYSYHFFPHKMRETKSKSLQLQINC